MIEMPTYWITAHVEEQYIVNAPDRETALDKVYSGEAYSRGDEIAEMTITHVEEAE